MPLLLAAEEPQRPLDRLDPGSRLLVISALVLMILLAVIGLVLIRLSGRWAKRMVRREEPPGPPIQDRVPSDWALASQASDAPGVSDDAEENQYKQDDAEDSDPDGGEETHEDE